MISDCVPRQFRGRIVHPRFPNVLYRNIGGVMDLAAGLFQPQAKISVFKIMKVSFIESVGAMPCLGCDQETGRRIEISILNYPTNCAEPAEIVTVNRRCA